MPVHDWNRVEAGVFHHFHNAWAMRISDALNEGLLPKGYYALAEQHGLRRVADVLTLSIADPDRPASPGGGVGGVALAEPKVTRRLIATEEANHRRLRRTIAVRHVSTHRIVALIEIVSPRNKDRPRSVTDFVAKCHSALQLGCHVLVLDLFPPGTHDPQGLHAAIWELFGTDEEPVPTAKPLILGSYMAGMIPEAFVEFVGVGDVLPEMPLFLEHHWGIQVPLEATYLAAYGSVPAVWRGVVEENLPEATT
jgi:hypothetical protein